MASQQPSSRNREIKNRDTKAEIRVGVVGVGRGQSFTRLAASAGMKLVAICDAFAKNLDQVATNYGVKAYREYEQFLEHEMDAVILANYFHQHASLAIQALERGLHVMSETASCATMGEGVALIRAVEKSGRIYMLAENCPYTAPVQELTRLYQAGEIGEVQYAEGQYVHPMDPNGRLRLSPGLNHWRNHMPATYYCSHALAPLMVVTDTMPTKVNALAIPYAPGEDRGVSRRDKASVILCRMENGAVFRLIQGGLSEHSLAFRFHGTQGMMETPRALPGKVRIVHEAWNRPGNEPLEKLYQAEFREHQDLARNVGHSGADFWTNLYFAQAIREGKQPYLDVYRGVAMAAIGILGWRSALEDGTPYEIPDLRSEEARKAYENDDWSPFPEHFRPGQPPSSIEGRIEPSAEAIRAAEEVWGA